MNSLKVHFKNITSNKATLIASFVGLFLISLGVSILVFSAIAPKTANNIIGNIARKSKINLDAPKVAECPVNGQMFTQAEGDIWETRRPVTAIIENNLESRPVFGLAYADVVYEAVAEGGITRYMSVFYCGVSADTVKAAPIRSARVYFINMAAGYGSNPIFLHYGGANDFCPSCPGGVKPRGDIDKTVNAYALLDKLGWTNGRSGNDMDGQSNVGFPVIERNQNRLGANITLAWEHSVVADLDKVYEEAAKRGFAAKDSSGKLWSDGFKKWEFQDGKPSATPTVSNIKFGFWQNQPDYDVEWKYDSSTNSYKRWNGGKEHMEWNLDKPQVSAKNVVIMFAEEKGPVDNEKHMFYQVTGTGKALIFQNGTVVTGTWSKPTALDREVFYDDNRDIVPMVRGATWIEIVPAGNSISY